MNPLKPFLPVAALAAFLSTPAFAQTPAAGKIPAKVAPAKAAPTAPASGPTEKIVAFFITTETPPRFVTMFPMGGLDTSGKAVSSRQIFTLVDANGGDLADGDDIQIKYLDGQSGKPNYWHENTDTINRVGTNKDKEVNFKFKKNQGGFSFQTSSGKFVALGMNNGSLTLTDTLESAAVFDIDENPTP